MIDKIWYVGQEEAEQATIEKCAHLHVSYRTSFESDDGVVTVGWWECDAGCGTRFIPVEVRDVSFIEHFQVELGGTGDES